MNMKKILATLLAVVMVLGTTGVSFAAYEEIVVDAAITITEDTLYKNKTFVRAEGYTGTFFNVTDGTLTLEDCVVDAGADWTIEDGKMDELVDIVENGGTIAEDIDEVVTPGADNVVTDENLINVTGEGGLVLDGTVVENMYAVTAVNAIKVSSNDKNIVVLNDAVIRNIAAQGNAVALNIWGMGEDEVTLSGDTEIYNTVGKSNPGTAIVIGGGDINQADIANGIYHVGDPAIVMEDGVKIYGNVGINASIMMVRRATFNMDGGELSGNYCLYSGRNGNLSPLYIHDGTDFDMTGGEISGNYGYFGNAVIANKASDVVLDGGKIGEGMESNFIAGSVVSNSPVEVGEKTTVEGGLYATPVAPVVNNGTIKGNVETHGTLENNGTIDGNLYAFDTVENEGTIEGDVTLVGLEATIEGEGEVTGSFVYDGIAVALYDGVKYDDLDDAIAAANGEEITLLANAELGTKLDNTTINIDLNGYKMDVNVGANYLIGDNSLKNGTVDISKSSSSQNTFGLAQYNATPTTLTMDKVNFIGDGYNSGYGIFEIGNSGAPVALKITNSTIDLKNDNAGKGGFVKGSGGDDAFTLTNTKVKLYNTDMFAVNVVADVEDSEIIAENLVGTALRNFGGTIDNSLIKVTNSENGIRTEDAVYDLTVSNNSKILVTGSTNTEEGKIGDIVLSAGSTLTVDETSEVLADLVTVADENDVTGNVVSKADTVYVQFKPVEDETVAEDEKAYELVLVGANNEKINELASADLTIDFDGTPLKSENKMTYTLIPAEGVTLSQTGKEGEEHRYMFNYDGVTKYEETKVEIVLGTITINGFGSFTLDIEEENTNAVYATKIVNNVVEGFTPGANLVINTKMDEGDDDSADGLFGTISSEVEVPVRTLTINVTFPNSVQNNEAAYQNMTVKIAGGDVNKTVALGTSYSDADELYPATLIQNGTTVAAAYEIEVALPYNTAYMVTVEGDGYRTARYTVKLTDNKTLNFWNNVMDEDNMIEVEEDAEATATTKTFLAGDIVKDNQINVYDLSAVVSYFGKRVTVAEAPNYAKYDLDRNGIIDARDVAYVLVSWGG